MVDDRRARIRRNMARAWAFAAAAHAQSIQNISWDLYGNPVGLAGGMISATLSTPAGGIPELVAIGTRVAPTRVVGATEYHTTASVSIGTASANRRVFLAGFSSPGYQQSLVKASIGGVAATIHYTGIGNIDNGSSFIISADVPTGTVGSFSASWGAGVNNGDCIFYVYVADKSAFANPSPTIVSKTGPCFNGSPVTASITNSADACIIAIFMHGAIATSQHITVSPSANFAYTKVIDASSWKGVLHANNVAAQVSTVPAHSITGTETANIAIMAWR